MKRLLTISLGGLLLALLTTCDGPPERDPQTIFRYNEAAGIGSLDPAFARNQANIWAVQQLFNGLVQMDPNLRVQPAIAKRWTIQDSGLTYRFFLRRDVYFHADPCFDSLAQRRVSAADFVYSFQRLTSAALAAPGAWVFANVARYEAQNDSTLEIRLKTPFPPFLGLLTMNYCSVVPQEAVTHYGSAFRRHPVGTGPFQFKRWVENELLVFRRNERYFERDVKGNRLPYLEAVAISFVPDKQSAFLRFLKGEIDLISGLDGSYKDELLTHDGRLRKRYRDRFLLYRQPYLNTEYLGFLVDSNASAAAGSPVLNRKVRQAINYAFDRERMIRYLRNGIGTPAQGGMIPAGLPAYDTNRIQGYHHDPARARRLLREAGYPEGKGLPPIKLVTNSNYRDLCEYIQAQAQKVGIPLEVEVTPPSTLRQGKATAKLPMFRASWIADYPDAENYLSLFFSQNFAPEGPNYTHFADPHYDSLYQQARATLDDSLRLRLYQRMDQRIIEQAPVVPLYYDQVLRFYPKHVHDLGGNALNLLNLKRVWKSDAG
jgi:peptide/nickel transport system substrate-binding protein